MTDPANPQRRRLRLRPRGARSPRRRPSVLAVITATLGLFFIVLTLLAIQVRNGRDPALGPGPVVATSGQPVTAGGKASQAQKAATVVTRTSPTHP